MGTLIKLEFSKLFKREITYIGFIAIFLIVVIIQIGMFIEGQKLLDFLVKSMADVFVFEGSLINTYSVTYIILNSLWLHIPILVAIVAGDMVSGEAGRGTFRLLLTRPLSRTQLLTAKYITAQAYTSMLVIFLMVLSLGLGHFFWEPGDMMVLMNTINILEAHVFLMDNQEMWQNRSQQMPLNQRKANLSIASHRLSLRQNGLRPVQAQQPCYSYLS